MPRLMNLLGVASIGKAVWDTLLLKRLLSDIAGIFILAIIAGMMAGAVLLGGCYGLMRLLMHYGLDADAALLTVGGFVAAIGLLAAALAISRIRRLRESLQPLSPIASQVGDIANAFMDGLREKE